jgi:hypothetical protein
MRTTSVLLAMILLGTATAGHAQVTAPNDELMRRLERVERALDRLERDFALLSSQRSPREAGRRQEVVAAVSQHCGANCGMVAQSYCRGIGFNNGVPLRIEPRGLGNFDHVVQVRCFN